MEVTKAEKSKGQGEHGVKAAETRGYWRVLCVRVFVCVCIYVCVCLLRTHIRSLFWLDKEQGIAAAWLYWIGMRGLTWVQRVHWVLSLVDWEGKIPWVPKTSRAGVP